MTTRVSTLRGWTVCLLRSAPLSLVCAWTYVCDPCESLRRKVGWRNVGGTDLKQWHRRDHSRNELLRSTPCCTRSMAREISQRELRNESGENMRRLDKDERFVVTRNRTPVGELAPLRRHRFVSAEAARALFQGAPAVDLAKLRADLDEVASQSASPRA